MENLEDEFQIDYDDNDDDTEEEYRGENQAPFDPTKISMSRRTMSLDSLIKRLKHNELNLSPDFQREKNIWPRGAQSRLIESLLLRIPIPAFYFDATNENEWLVIDGVQRLTALARFVMDEETLGEPHLQLSKLVLRGLEFLVGLNGMKFANLDRADQRSIEETDFTIYTVAKPTPENVKYNIFKRINTGGVALSDQEIRNAFHAGKATALLDKLAKSNEFLNATRGAIDRQRRADQECVLRFIAFTLPIAAEYREHEKQDFDQFLKEYRKQGFDQFLRDTMDRMNGMSSDKLEQLGNQFKKAMDAAHKIFDQHAFCEAVNGKYREGKVNIALFEVWSVHLGQLSDAERSKLLQKKEYVTNKFLGLLEDLNFSNTIGSSNVESVTLRFEKVKRFINEILHGQDPWENIEERYPIGKTVNGKILRIVNFDTFVESERGILGLIHTSELSWTKQYSNPREFFKVGDEVKVVVIEIDPDKQIVILSPKRTKPDPWADAAKKYSVGSVVRGKIVKIIQHGAFAKLQDGIEGFIHISELAPGYTQKVEDVVSSGQELDLKMINLDRNNRKIELSLKAMHDKQQQHKKQQNPPHNKPDNHPTYGNLIQKELDRVASEKVNDSSPTKPTSEGGT